MLAGELIRGRISLHTLLPWALSVGIVTVRDIRVYDRPPLPSEFVATGALFAALTVLAQANPQLAGALSWGLLGAVVLKTATGGGALNRKSAQQEKGGTRRGR